MNVDSIVTESFDLSPQETMTKDALLLERLDPAGPIVLHLYEWKGPSLTYGHFIDPDKHLRIDALRKHDIGIAKRPTGGGIIFHLTDFAFSLLIPAFSPHFSLNPEENYARINGRVAELVTGLTGNRCRPALFDFPEPSRQKEIAPFCMAKTTRFDLTIEEKKVGGSAQRLKAKKGLLHQGSLFLAPLPSELPRELLKDESTIACMSRKSGSLLDKPTPEDLAHARSELRRLFKKTIRTFFD